MNKQNEMLIAASGAIENIFMPITSDKVLILTDKHSISIAQAFKDSFIKYGCVVDSFVIEDEMRPLKEIPASLEKLLRGKTIVLNIIKAYSEEIPFRIKWIFKIRKYYCVCKPHPRPLSSRRRGGKGLPSIPHSQAAGKGRVR